jgi:hypothetical protein
MKTLRIVLGAVVVLALASAPVAAASFDRSFSIPREPETVLTPGQYFELAIPSGRRVVITDIYIENFGPGPSTLRILEQRGPVTFENRYTFRTPEGGTTIVNYTTGLKLGDEVPIAGTIRIENASNGAVLISRVNGVVVP